MANQIFTNSVVLDPPASFDTNHIWGSANIWAERSGGYNDKNIRIQSYCAGGWQERDSSLTDASISYETWIFNGSSAIRPTARVSLNDTIWRNNNTLRNLPCTSSSTVTSVYGYKESPASILQNLEWPTTNSLNVRGYFYSDYQTSGAILTSTFALTPDIPYYDIKFYVSGINITSMNQLQFYVNIDSDHSTVATAPMNLKIVAQVEIQKAGRTYYEQTSGTIPSGSISTDSWMLITNSNLQDCDSIKIKISGYGGDQATSTYNLVGAADQTYPRDTRTVSITNAKSGPRYYSFQARINSALDYDTTVIAEISSLGKNTNTLLRSGSTTSNTFIFTGLNENTAYTIDIYVCIDGNKKFQIGHISSTIRTGTTPLLSDYNTVVSTNNISFKIRMSDTFDKSVLIRVTGTNIATQNQTITSGMYTPNNFVYDDLTPGTLYTFTVTAYYNGTAGDSYILDSRSFSWTTSSIECTPSFENIEYFLDYIKFNIRIDRTYDKPVLALVYARKNRTTVKNGTRVTIPLGQQVTSTVILHNDLELNSEYDLGVSIYYGSTTSDPVAGSAYSQNSYTLTGFDWEKTKNKTTNSDFDITAVDWNNINTLLQKKSSAHNITYTPDQVSKNEVFRASHYNKVINGLKKFTSSSSLHTVNTGDTITANDINIIKTFLNTHYNMS